MLAPQIVRADHVACQSETVKRGEVQPVKNVCKWVVRPLRTNAGWAGAVLSINGTEYAAECFLAVDDSGRVTQVIDLRKDADTHYRLTFRGTEAHCDCPQATYRQCRCKHSAAVRAALDFLEAKEREEWELQVALRALNVDLTKAPF